MQLFILIAIAVAAGILLASNLGLVLALLAGLFVVAILGTLATLLGALGLVNVAAGVGLPLAAAVNRLSLPALERLITTARWFLKVSAAVLLVWLISSAVSLNVSLGRLSQTEGRWWNLGATAMMLFAILATERGSAPASRSLPSRNQMELRLGLAHVAYEFVAFQQAHAAFRQSASPAGSSALYLEVALLHARNLIEFLWAPSGKRRAQFDGIYAANYLTDADWRAIRASLRQFPNECYRELCAQLSHISVGRLSDKSRDFATDFERLAGDLTSAWNRWRDELRGTAWDRALQEQINRLDTPHDH